MWPASFTAEGCLKENRKNPLLNTYVGNIFHWGILVILMKSYFSKQIFSMQNISEKIIKLFQETSAGNDNDDDENLPLECFICAATFELKNTFQQHFNKQHNKRTHIEKEKKYPCTFDGCFKIFDTSSNLKQHLVSNFTY
jgi:uncharacterized C2H2 Zn-finger protein